MTVPTENQLLTQLQSDRLTADIAARRDHLRGEIAGTLKWSEDHQDPVPTSDVIHYCRAVRAQSRAATFEAARLESLTAKGKAKPFKAPDPDLDAEAADVFPILAARRSGVDYATYVIRAWTVGQRNEIDSCDRQIAMYSDSYRAGNSDLGETEDRLRPLIDKRAELEARLAPVAAALGAFPAKFAELLAPVVERNGGRSETAGDLSAAHKLMAKGDDPSGLKAQLADAEGQLDRVDDEEGSKFVATLRRTIDDVKARIGSQAADAKAERRANAEGLLGRALEGDVPSWATVHDYAKAQPALFSDGFADAWQRAGSQALIAAGGGHFLDVLLPAS